MTTSNNDIVFAADGQVAGTTPENTDWRSMYESQREESERLSAVIAAGRLQPSTAKGDDRKPAVTAERLKGLVGPTQFLKMNRNEKLVGLGIDPASVDDSVLHQLFGKGNDGKAAKDLSNSNMYRYRQLREAALVLGIFCA